MDTKEYRRKYYQANKERLQAYQRWYYQKRKNEKIDSVKTIKKKPISFYRTYGNFIIHFE
mgnify:CR=1 FL=1|tara:strand:+ start:6582 stop:6761 length:180 start_codon:yes stop_codon:yes gene_type:complete